MTYVPAPKQHRMIKTVNTYRQITRAPWEMSNIDVNSLIKLFTDFILFTLCKVLLTFFINIRKYKEKKEVITSLKNIYKAIDIITF